MKQNDLKALVVKARAGDKKALEELILACYSDLAYFALRTVKDEELAADITQDSCIEIISSIEKLENPDAFLSWSRTIVYHRCMRHFNSKKDVIVEADEDGETIFDKLPDEDEGSLPEQVVQDKEFQHVMQQLLDTLPEDQRAALMLYYYEKLSVKQIAEVQGVSEGTVKSRLNYGRKAVKERVEAYEKKSGTKLHGILPLLLFYFFNDAKVATPVPSAVSAAFSGGGVAAGATAATAGTSAAATTSATGASTATATAATGVAAGGLPSLRRRPHQARPQGEA